MTDGRSEAPASKGRLVLFTVVGVLGMMALVALTQYLVSGEVNPAIMVAIGAPTGVVLGQNLSKRRGRT